MKYIFIDIDGTLLSHKLNKVPESALLALKKLKENGHRIFICTGRALATCRDFYDLDVDGFVFNAGALVYANKQRIYSNSFSSSESKVIIDLIDKYGLGYMLEGEAGCYHNELAKINNEEFVRSHFKELELEQAYLEFRMYSLDYHDPRDPIYKICSYGSDRELFERFMLEIPSEYHCVLMTGEVDSDRIGLELTLKGVNKATAAKRICEYYGATLNDAVAIGDSMNDYEIIRDCKIGIAMGNSTDKVKEVADFVTDEASNDGLYKAFKSIGLI
ncbi:MAG: HAD family hydrolase [Anaerorhabdus sp.]